MVKILVVCTHNSARSQMAEAYLRKYLPPEVEIKSAGTHPTGIHPFTIAVMAEEGYDLSHHTSDPIEKYSSQEWDYIITVCDTAKESCPYLPARFQLHVSFPDPSKGGIELFREVRDAIKKWAQEFAQGLHATLH
ncbi:MAG: arsenate reductase ArsC [Bacteroidia bacterium]|nr:arsenate reductase ArsC [Bacteroidia bacterium]MDW8134565.1 arsenate reductase ArsC [Bacteroidia bacterium]